MATKSLYELEDVCATLMYALETHNHKLVIQAARELRISGEMDLLVNFVLMAWLLCEPHILPMGRAPTHDTLFEDLCAVMEHFPAQIPKHKSMLLLPLPSPPERATEAVAHCISNKHWKPCLRMLITFLHKDAALLRTILTEQFHATAQMLEVLDRIVYQPLAERFLYHFVINHIHPVSCQSSLVKKYASIWTSQVEGRAARTFQIPFDALGVWNVRPKSRDRLQGTLIPCSVSDDSSSMYWQNANPPPSEDLIESWFSQHFPDDIPDEWPLDEIQKSHVESIPLPNANATATAKSEWQPAFLLCWS
jgi:hypothetical protein